MTPEATTRKRRKIDAGLLAASLVIAAGIVLIVWGVTSAVTGDDGIDRPEAIESIQPVENAIQVLRQDQIIVDFEYGYEAVLILDGTEIPTTVLGQVEAEPGTQVELPPTAIWDPGNAVLSFQPTEGAVVEEFTPGVHHAQVIFWQAIEGRDHASSYRWSFNVV